MKHLKILAGLLLFVQAFQFALPQTIRPVLAISDSWLRDEAGEENGIQGNVGVEEAERDDGNGDASGTMSGAMEIENRIEQRVTGPAGRQNSTASPEVQSPTVASDESPQRNTTASPPVAKPTTAVPVAKTEAGSNVNSTATPQNVTAVENSSGGGNVTSAPEPKSTAKPDQESEDNTGLSNSTTATNETSTRPPAVSGKPGGMPSSPVTKVAGDETEKSTGDTADRGSELDTQNRARQQAWGAVLATAVAVACVGLVVYIILRKKYPKGFSHRKLVEEFPSDPVLRLDNSEPLDLNFGRMGYRNPGQQMDDIQMSRIPRGQ